MTLHSEAISIGYTLTLLDGTEIGGNTGGAPVPCSPGQEQMLAALEEAVRGMARGDAKRILLTHERGDDLKLDVARLAFVLGYPGEDLVLNVEIL